MEKPVSYTHLDVYKRQLGFNMLKMYRNIIGKTWICLVLAGAGAYIGSLFTSHAGTKMIIGVLAFVIVYRCV